MAMLASCILLSSVDASPDSSTEVNKDVAENHAAVNDTVGEAVVEEEASTTEAESQERNTSDQSNADAQDLDFFSSELSNIAKDTPGFSKAKEVQRELDTLTCKDLVDRFPPRPVGIANANAVTYDWFWDHKLQKRRLVMVVGSESETDGLAGFLIYVANLAPAE
jgi:hypothetical protein